MLGMAGAIASLTTRISIDDQRFVVAVAKEGGVSSELLDRLLDFPGTPDLVKARILPERGM